MLPLQAEIRTEAWPAAKRRAARRILHLELETSSSLDTTRALVRNLSERGLLIETTANLGVGDTIHVDLPEAGPCPARVVWTEGFFIGCEFKTAVSKAAVSAALLLAPPGGPQLRSDLPLVPAEAPFGGEQLSYEQNPSTEPTAVRVVLLASLILFLLSVGLFIFAMLALPISGL
jgi:hypothetical protein